jgi:glycosyltransferase involved in cell wall biosynthesis
MVLKIGLYILFFIASTFYSVLNGNLEQKSFVVVTASYNNKEWYQRNLESIFNQDYKNWRLIYINDCSIDGTGELVEAFIAANAKQDRVKLINNTKRQGHLYNQYYAIHSCAKDEIIVIVDGDDWLAHTHVFSYLNKIYQDPNVWMTYGQFWYFKKDKLGFCKKVPNKIIKNNLIRDYPEWVLSHLRTFYAGLFHLIKIEDLYYHDDFFPMSADLAVMYPLFEMAAERAQFISKILYIYNDANPISFTHNSPEKQGEIRHEICYNYPRYKRLKNPIFLHS